MEGSVDSNGRRAPRTSWRKAAFLAQRDFSLIAMHTALVAAASYLSSPKFTWIPCHVGRIHSPARNDGAPPSHATQPRLSAY